VDRGLLALIWEAAVGPPELVQHVRFTGSRVLASRYPVADLASASIGAAGLALAEFATGGRQVPVVEVDRELAGAWFGRTFAPRGWEPAPLWDAIAGDYLSSDGWIRLHTNDPVHRAAALRVLEVPGAREQVSAAVSSWAGEDLEAAVVAAGGCAAQLRSPEQWRNHPQGIAVARDGLISRAFTDLSPTATTPGPVDRPLEGLKVLDLTRVLAGPAATRFLAGFGATVLRIDPPGRQEPGLEIEMTLGKRCARMDLREHRAELLALLERADVLIHGYRPGALDGLGLDERALRDARPGLVEVMLDAYGWSGPWRDRRGFDSLVQMSSGIAHPPYPGGPRPEGPRPGGPRPEGPRPEGPRPEGHCEASAAVPELPPQPLPVQALDQATGYLAATAALRGLSERRRTGLGSVHRLSLARTAMLLQDHAAVAEDEAVEAVDFSGATVEHTPWGAVDRLPGPVAVGAARMFFAVPAAPFGSAPPTW